MTRSRKAARKGRGRKSDKNNTPNSPGTRIRTPKYWIGPGVIAIVFVALVRWTWGTWPDVLIDFGRELYVPWRLVAGELLYRDIAYFNGPLSPHVNALLFRLFGTHLDTLVGANLVILGLVCALMYALLRRMGGALGATAATLVFLTVFGVAQLDAGGNYNFVTPYAHELTHGTLLAMTALLCVWWHQRRPGFGPVTTAGLVVGLTFLTKAEIFVATGTTVVIGFGAVQWVRARTIGQTARFGAVLSVAALIPGLFAWGALANRLGPQPALIGVLGSWPGTLNTSLRNSVFYSRMIGMDRPLSNLAIMLAVSALWFVVYGAFAYWSSQTSADRRRETTSALFIGVPILALAVANITKLQAASVWLLRPLPIVLGVLGLLQIAEIRRLRSSEADRDRLDRAVLRLSWIAFAGLILSKIILRPIPSLYGFALAMPATVVVVTAAVDWHPAVLITRRRGGRQLQAITLILVTAFAFVQLSRTRNFISMKTETLATDRGSLRIYPIERAVVDVVSDLENSLTQNDTLAVMPEGVMLNFLTGHRNPTPYINFMPPELALFGEESMLRAFEQHPPDWLVLTYKPVPEYGLQGFGFDFGLDLARWVTDGNTVERLYEIPSPYERRFTKILLVRRSADQISPDGKIEP